MTGATALGVGDAAIPAAGSRSGFYDQWVKVRNLAKSRIAEADLNVRTKRQRQELYWFLLISVGAALRVGEAYSLRWRDCELITLNDKDHTEAVHMWVLGKHSRDGKREDAYGAFGAVSAFKARRAARPDAKPDDTLFTENHREGVEELLIKADLRSDTDGRIRDAKSLRRTGISLRLDLGPSPDYRNIARWPGRVHGWSRRSTTRPGPLVTIEFGEDNRSEHERHARDAKLRAPVHFIEELVMQQHIGIDENKRLPPVSLSALPIRFPVLSQHIAALSPPARRTQQQSSPRQLARQLS